MHIVSIATHPIQYQVPLFRMLHAKKDVRMTALFFSDHSVQGGVDAGFGRDIKWDVPMLEGYEHRMLSSEGAGNAGHGFRAYRYSNFKLQFTELKPDVVLIPGHSVALYWQAVFAARSLGIPVIVRPESLDGAQPQRPAWKSLVRKILLGQLYGRIDAFCATGHFARRDAERLGFKPEAIFNSPYCIDTELLEGKFATARGERSTVRAELGVDDDTLVAIFMAKFIDWKNPSLILDAIESLPEAERRGIFPLLVGSGPDFEKVSARAKALTGSATCCPGFVNQSELARYYAAADCAVLPSKRGHESWGLVVNEAMTCGLPVAVSDGVGSRVDLVHPGKTGEIFEDGDAPALGRILLDWQKNPGKRQQMGSNASVLIKHYSSEKAVEGILAAARSLRDG